MTDQMTNESNGGLACVFKTFVALVLLAAFLLGLGAWLESSQAPPPRERRVFTDEERAYVTARMKHHGIDRAELNDETGERYFYRGGERCKL